MIKCFKCAQSMLRGFQSQSPIQKGLVLNFPSSNLIYRTYSSSSKSKSTTTTSTPEELDPLAELDKPIQYTTSKASQWTAQETHMGQIHKDTPWYQPLVVCGSVACLLLWFTIFREENDMDEEIGKTLWERVPGLEKQQLIMLKTYNLQHSSGQTTVGLKEIDQRLQEIEKQEKEKKSKAQNVQESKVE